MTEPDFDLAGTAKYFPNKDANNFSSALKITNQSIDNAASSAADIAKHFEDVSTTLLFLKTT